MIISVDTGNKHMKTENCEFNSGVEILDTLPGDMEEVIEYEGKCHIIILYQVASATASPRYNFCC